VSANPNLPKSEGSTVNHPFPKEVNMSTVASTPANSHLTSLVADAIAAAGGRLHDLACADELDRSMAAYDLAGAIQCAAPLLTASERAEFARFLVGGAA
jgi:hypothetical protein